MFSIVVVLRAVILTRPDRTRLRRCVDAGCALTGQPTSHRRCAGCGSRTSAFAPTDRKDPS
jgi:hypothetical protein